MNKVAIVLLIICLEIQGWFGFDRLVTVGIESAPSQKVSQWISNPRLDYIMMNPQINPCANGVTEYVDSGFSFTSLGSSSTPQGNQDKIMSKRAAQNRAAQKAFRQRKDLYIKDLELKAKSLTQREAALDLLKTENESLKSRLKELEGENARLRKSLNIQPDKSPTRPSQDPSFRYFSASY
ncbi:hypothetical protein DSO57_1029397 [Entomophthora muscae]|uniref:Uncharacterized protein n=1 Tax=Entomophthora muscae TaxID=34485 RepID=A0ACC2SEA3_9FUNG|nr:hypothetical protein DSO57_1029397 [Entomophthora muscae]